MLFRSLHDHHRNRASLRPGYSSLSYLKDLPVHELKMLYKPGTDQETALPPSPEHRIVQGARAAARVRVMSLSSHSVQLRRPPAVGDIGYGSSLDDHRRES